MTDRDELAGIVQNSCAQTGMDWVYDHEALEVSEAIIAAGYRKPRAITTAAELDALPLGAVARDAIGETWELTDNGWRYWVYEESFKSLELDLPATVLHEPVADS